VALAGSRDKGGLSRGTALEDLVHKARGEGSYAILTALLSEPSLALRGEKRGVELRLGIKSRQQVRRVSPYGCQL
jgi:hypothetical protein